MQILTGEQSKAKSPVPILGMLQTSKSTVIEHDPNHLNDLNDHANLFDALDNDEANGALNQDMEKNPIINKRILLKVNDLDGQFPSNDVDGNPDDEFNMNVIDDIKPMPDINKVNKSDAIEPNEIREQKIFDKMRLNKPLPDAAIVLPLNENVNEQSTADRLTTLKEGRIVVYGDSNCLDATHTEKEKSCFWLLDAMLEYTMSSHISGLLKDLNRSSNIRFDANPNKMPKRLPNNNLHMYSKVLMPLTMNDDASMNNDISKPLMPLLKRPRPECQTIRWETPIFLNISAPNDFQYLNGHRDDNDGDVSNMVEELSSIRKLESQKGEVCSDLFKC